MATKTKPGNSQGFLASYTDDDLKKAIVEAVAATAYEYSLLDRPATPISAADRVLLGIARKDLTTVDLTRWRIAYWEGVQDRLWNWYRHGETSETGSQGR
jgi:hypothetical protein